MAGCCNYSHSLMVLNFAFVCLVAGSARQMTFQAASQAKSVDGLVILFNFCSFSFGCKLLVVCMRFDHIWSTYGCCGATHTQTWECELATECAWLPQDGFTDDTNGQGKRRRMLSSNGRKLAQF